LFVGKRDPIPQPTVHLSQSSLSVAHRICGVRFKKATKLTATQLGSTCCVETGGCFAGRVDMLLNVAGILGDGKSMSVFSRHRLQRAVVF
jgi:hypothetical protein